MTTAVTVINDEKAVAILKQQGIDTSLMAPEDARELAMALYDSFVENMDGFNYRPQKITINKESQSFTLPTGDSIKEVRGIILYAKKIRAYYHPDQADDDKVPTCSSMDCINGKERDELDENGNTTKVGRTKPCASCEQNQWGTAVDDKGKPTRGKACKESRKTYIMLPGFELPSILTLPVTSMKTWDNFCSGIASAGKSFLSREVVLTLSKKGEGKKTYAVINEPSLGNPSAPQEMMKNYNLLKRFIDMWKNEQITREDVAETGEFDGSATSDADMDAAFGGTTVDVSSDGGKAWD